MKDRAFITGGSCRARICMEGVEISRLSVQQGRTGCGGDPQDVIWRT